MNNKRASYKQARPKIALTILESRKRTHRLWWFSSYQATFRIYGNFSLLTHTQSRHKNWLNLMLWTTNTRDSVKREFICECAYVGGCSRLDARLRFVRTCVIKVYIVLCWEACHQANENKTCFSIHSCSVFFMFLIRLKINVSNWLLN